MRRHLMMKGTLIPGEKAHRKARAKRAPGSLKGLPPGEKSHRKAPSEAIPGGSGGSPPRKEGSCEVLVVVTSAHVYYRM
jgi:hypothetical protein